MRPYFIPERSRTKSETGIDPIFMENVAALEMTTTSTTSAGLFMCGGGIESPMPPINGGGAIVMTEMDTSCDGLFEMNGINNNNNMVAIPCAMTAAAIAATKSVGARRSEQTKKSKSLEDLFNGSSRSRNLVEGSQPSHEMEFVSSRIQKLKVQD